MNGWVILALIVLAVVIFVAGFFVGGKHKESLLRKVGLLRETAETVAATIREAKKKL